jgi:hypothetical protein
MKHLRPLTAALTAALYLTCSACTSTNEPTTEGAGASTGNDSTYRASTVVVDSQRRVIDSLQTVLRDRNLHLDSNFETVDSGQRIP